MAEIDKSQRMSQLMNRLNDWDSGKCIKSVEMGGLGKAYEYAIQHSSIEILRYVIANPIDDSIFANNDLEAWGKIRRKIDNYLSSDDIFCNLSGAMHSAAYSLAMRLYRFGIDTLNDKEIEPRIILISK